MRLRPVLGVIVAGLPPVFAPAWTIAVASIGAVAVLLAGRRPAAGSVAVGAAIVTCAFSHAGIPALAAEGLLILAYLLAGDSRFPRRQLIAGVAATLVVAAALVVHPGASPWLTGTGLLAAVAAFALAVPARGPGLHAGQDPGAALGPPNPLRSDPLRWSRGQ